MDNLLDYIIPIVFAAIYFFGNMLSKGGDDAEAPPARRVSRDEDPDVLERQRRIQEEIRRKILERRNATNPAPDAAPAPQRQTAEFSREHSPAHSPAAESARQRHIAETARQRHPAELAQPEPSSTQPDAYETEMQAKLRQIEATERQAQKLAKQARAARQQSSSAATPSGAQTSRSKRGPVRAILRDPAAARAAFIYSEVMGPPISQRKAPTVPGLT
jgi:hypothetical protein